MCVKVKASQRWDVFRDTVYIGQRSFCSKVIVLTQAHTRDRQLYLDH